MQATAGTPSTLIDTLWPRESGGLIRLALLAVAGSALMALSARVQVPMSPVPMTMQTFGVLAIGMAYGARLAGATLLLYLAEGAVGLPVFAGGAGGAVHLAGPTGGYLIGFLPAAVLVGWFGERGWDRHPVSTFAAMLAGTLVIFAFGVPWLAVFLGDFAKAVAVGLLPFVAGDLLKVALATAVLPVVWKFALRRSGSPGG